MATALLPNCEMCATDSAAWVYQVTPIKPIPGLENVLLTVLAEDPERPWLACNTCKELVDAGSKLELASRVLHILVAEDHPVVSYLPYEEVLVGLTKFFGEFMAHRQGPALPYEATP